MPIPAVHSQRWRNSYCILPDGNSAACSISGGVLVSDSPKKSKRTKYKSEIIHEFPIQVKFGNISIRLILNFSLQVLIHEKLGLEHKIYWESTYVKNI